MRLWVGPFGYEQQLSPGHSRIIILVQPCFVVTPIGPTIISDGIVDVVIQWPPVVTRGGIR